MAAKEGVRRVLVLASAAGVSLAVLGGWGAVPARASTRCSYSGPPDNSLSIKADGGAYSYIRREGDAIVVGEYEKPASQCAGGAPTVFNTDTIRLVYRGPFSDVDILLGGGPFAPGATPEAEGASEIEIELSGELHASVLGTSHTDEFHWGPGGPYRPGLNLNPRDSGDRDVDVTLQTKLAKLASLVAKGLGGDDTIIPTPGATFSRSNAGIWSQGWGGDDYLVAPRNGGGILEGLGGDDVLIGGKLGDDLIGGRGNDRLVGGGGPDRIDLFEGARGRDLILAGPGRDQINSRDSDRDQVRCGPGRDTVGADNHDRLRGCEVIRRQ